VIAAGLVVFAYEFLAPSDVDYVTYIVIGVAWVMGVSGRIYRQEMDIEIA